MHSSHELQIAKLGCKAEPAVEIGALRQTVKFNVSDRSKDWMFTYVVHKQ